MPDALALPRMLRAVVPHVRRERLSSFFRRSVVDEFVAFAFRWALRGRLFAGGRAGLYPGLAAVIGALDDLPEPSAGLRRVNSVRIRRRSLQVINLPASEVRTADLPAFAFSIGRQHKRSLARAHHNSHLAHF